MVGWYNLGIICLNCDETEALMKLKTATKLICWSKKIFKKKKIAILKIWDEKNMWQQNLSDNFFVSAKLCDGKFVWLNKLKI